MQVFLFLISLWFVSSISAYAVTADNAMYLNVSQKGLDLATQVISKNFLKDIENQAIGDIEYGNFLAGFSVKNTAFSTRFHSLKAFAENNYLLMQVNLRSVLVRSKDLQMQSGLYHVSCKDLVIHMGYHYPFPLKIYLNPKVSDNKITLNVQAVDFKMDKNNFKVFGPAHCTDVIGLNLFYNQIVNFVISKARTTIIKQIENRIQTMLPTFEDVLNEMTHGQFELDLSQFFPLKKKLLVNYAPYLITTKKDQFKVNLSVRLSAPTHYPAAFNKYFSTEQQRELYSSIGINEQLFTEFIQAVLTGNEQYQPLPVDLFPDLASFITKERLATILPDLNYLHITDQQIRILLKLEKAPEFKVSDQEQIIKIKVPKLVLKIQIKPEDQWVDYFYIESEVFSAVKPTIFDQFLVVNIGKLEGLNLNGYWDKNYTPTVSLFERDFAEMLINSIFEYLYTSNPIFKFELLVLPVGDEWLNFDRINFKSPFIEVDVTKFE